MKKIITYALTVLIAITSTVIPSYAATADNESRYIRASYKAYKK